MLKTHRTINMVLAALGALVVGRIVAMAGDAGGPRIIDLTADQDNRFKVPKQKEPVITMKVNEVAVLRITSRKGGEWDDKDGADAVQRLAQGFFSSLFDRLRLIWVVQFGRLFSAALFPFHLCQLPHNLLLI